MRIAARPVRHACRLDPICFDAALDYARLVRRVFAVKGVPLPCGHGYHANAGGREMDTEAARQLQRELDETEQRLRGISRVGAGAVRELAVYEREASPAQTEEASLVLRSL